MSDSNLEAVVLQVHIEKKIELDNVLTRLSGKIDNNTIPTPKDILTSNSNRNSKNDKTPRPPNSNILYTNMLNKVGYLDIIRKYCEDHEINKQKMVPISKKLSTILWRDLSEEHQNFFKRLASEVKAEHESMYPDYKFKPRRKGKGFHFKNYEPPTTPVENPSQISPELTPELEDDMQFSSSTENEDDPPTFELEGDMQFSSSTENEDGPPTFEEELLREEEYLFGFPDNYGPGHDFGGFESNDSFGPYH